MTAHGPLTDQWPQLQVDLVMPSLSQLHWQGQKQLFFV
jgi:hypothetical protein